MATMNSDLLITKTTVILDQPSDWQKWIFLRKDSAQRNDLWAYVNPNVATETVLKLEDEKPAKKEAGVFYGRGRTAGMVYDLEHLDEHEYRKYSAWYTSYQKELTKFEKKELALRQFNSEIATTISERRLHWIMNLDTPHARLRKLKNQLCPSTAERETQLLSQYLALRKMPKRANIESWLDSWEELLELMAAAEMAEVKGTRAQRDFLDSVQSTDDSWATSQRISMIAKQEEGESFLPAVDLVGRFRLYYRQTKPVASTLGTFAALGDPQEISQDTDKFRKINCLCGEKHRFIDCPYVNSAKRSSGWKADSDMKKKFDTIRSRGEGSRISAVLRSVEAKLAKQAQQSKPQSAAFDDGSTKSGRSSNACLQVEATQQSPSLLTRWILDPGSNLHVSNHRNSTWRKLADANAHDEILAGGQRIPIKEWGEVEIMINTPHGTSQIKLTWVA
ncbi:hypothetical protein Alg215_11137, partial [Pyrenophora tritici-repentis]